MSHIKLTGIDIRAFRKVRDPLRIDLTSPAGSPLDYLVLAGPNGSGKTTVLEAILLALGREELIVRDLPAPERPSSPRIRLEPDTVLAATFHDAREQRHGTVTRTANGLTVRYALGAGQWAALSPEQSHAALAALSVEYISSRRLPALVGPIQDDIRGRPPDNTETNRIWRLKHRIRQQQGRRVPGVGGPEPLDEAWLAALNRFWAQFRSDGSHIRMTLVDPGNLDVSEWDLFVYQGDQRVCSVDALSSGEQEVIAMIAPFITERFDGLLLVDEPELHLHPQWQGRIVRALRAALPGAQLVVATHADDPWDDATSWERRLLVPPDDPRVDGATP